MLRISICIIILLKFSYAYADENLEIQKAFNNIAKNIKTDQKHKDLDFIERKSNKFNVKITHNPDKNFNINSVLKKAKDSLNLGDNKAAISLLNQVITKFPYHKSALIGLGNIYYLNKDYKKAVEIYIKLSREYPRDQYILENFLMIASQYDSDIALSEMLKLYSTHRNYAPLLANLSLIYMKKENFLKAKEYMVAAISLDQSNIFYVYNLAIILDRLSDLKNAAAFYEKLLNMATISKSISDKMPLHKVAARLKFIKLNGMRSTTS